MLTVASFAVSGEKIKVEGKYFAVSIGLVHKFSNFQAKN